MPSRLIPWALQCPMIPPRSTRDFRLVTYHAYEEGIPFTRESWWGRIRPAEGLERPECLNTNQDGTCALLWVKPVSAGRAPHIDRYWRLWYTSGEVINYARL